MPRAANVRVVAHVPCAPCHGTGRDRDTYLGDREPGEQHPPCTLCHGTGEQEQELLHPGEPYFLLRAQDRLAPPCILSYEAMLMAHDLEAMAADVRRKFVLFTDWQQANPGLVKDPD